MEENQTTEQTTTTTTTTDENLRETNKQTCNCSMHPLLKLILLGLLTFFGAFCAAYVVIDWHAKQLLRPFYGPIPDIEKSIQQDMKAMDKTIKNEGRFLTPKNGNIIHMERNDDSYKIIIDLKPFDNNESNLTVATEGNVLTISGRSVKKEKNREAISRFQQSYMFGDDVRLEKMTKKTEHNHLIITLPIEDNDEE